MVFDTIEASGRLHRDLAEHVYMAPLVSFGVSRMTPKDYTKVYQAKVRAATYSLQTEKRSQIYLPKFFMGQKGL